MADLIARNRGRTGNYLVLIEYRAPHQGSSVLACIRAGSKERAIREVETLARLRGRAGRFPTFRGACRTTSTAGPFHMWGDDPAFEPNYLASQVRTYWRQREAAKARATPKRSGQK